MLDLKREMLFWNEIMRDHGRFQMVSLSCKEKDMVDMAKRFNLAFTNLYDQLLGIIEPKTKIKETKDLLNEFVQFQKNMLSKLMTCNIELTMTPTFLNDMINEAMEYYLVLCLSEDNIKFNVILEMIRIHKIWLFDAAGHAYFIAAQLDGIEDIHIKGALEYHHNFNALYTESTQLASLYERTLLETSNIVLFNNKVKILMKSFIAFLHELKDLKRDCKILTTGTFNELIPEHMIREEEYYLAKIDALTKLK